MAIGIEQSRGEEVKSMGQRIARTWERFKQGLGDGDFEAAIEAIEAAVMALKEHYGSELLSVMLFGSLARGNKGYDDIDLLIVIANERGPAGELTRNLAQSVFGPLFLDTGQLFSFLLYSETQLKALKGFLPLFDEIREDRIVLHGSDPFA